MRPACLAIFFLALGLGDGYLHLGTPGTCLRREQAQEVPAVQSSRRDQRTGAGPFKLAG